MLEHITWSQVASQFVFFLGTVFAAWVAFKKAQSEMVAKVEKVADKTDKVAEKTDMVLAMNAEQNKTMGRLEINVDGRVSQLLEKVELLGEAEKEAALKMGIQIGIQQERTRQEEIRARLLTTSEAAARVVVADAEAEAGKKMVTAEMRAERIVIRAEGVARELVEAGNLPTKSSPDTHGALTDAAHVAVQDLADEGHEKPAKP